MIFSDCVVLLQLKYVLYACFHSAFFLSDQ